MNFVKANQLKNYAMHLYDSWEPMLKDYLLKSEKYRIGKYRGISIEKTQKNLAEFNDHIIYHKAIYLTYLIYPLYLPNSSLIYIST